jgi:hypothetical protein
MEEIRNPKHEVRNKSKIPMIKTALQMTVANHSIAADASTTADTARLRFFCSRDTEFLF